MRILPVMCETYRYALYRKVVQGRGRRRLVWLMLNPSTADHLVNDRTVSRVIEFTRAWGYDELIVVNLYALRSTDPAALWTHDDPVGPHNDEHIRNNVFGMNVVCGWGGEADKGRVAEVLEILREECAAVWCLHVNQDGSPKHPLYVKGDTQLIPYP